MECGLWQVANKRTAQMLGMSFTVVGTIIVQQSITIGFWEGTHDDMIIERDQHLGDVQVVGV